MASGARKYYHTDLLGSTRAVVEGATVVESYDYDPWGVLMPGRTLGGGTKEGFTGKERDAESGLDYFGARLYMSALGRRTTVDPPADKFPEWNPYNYVFNNPAGLTDPDGNSPDCMQTRIVCIFKFGGQFFASQIASPMQRPAPLGASEGPAMDITIGISEPQGSHAQQLDQLVENAKNTLGARTVESDVPKLPGERVSRMHRLEPTSAKPQPNTSGHYQMHRVGNRVLTRVFVPAALIGELRSAWVAQREAERLNISPWLYMSLQMQGATPAEIERAVQLNRNVSPDT